MTKKDVYDLALSILDRKIVDMSESSKEIYFLNLNYSKCVQFVLKAWDYPFMIKRVVFTEDDLTEDYWKYSFGYLLPDDFGHAVQINEDYSNAYSVRFDILWTNIANPILEYIPNTLAVDEDENFISPTGRSLPDDFISLIAYQLALHIAPILDPDSSATSIAAQMYQMTLESIKENEYRTNEREENFGASTLWADEAGAFDLAKYRRKLFEER